ncbi:MAG: hypothetical protein O3C36_05550 [archaeon]|nr:hypothetical protein [archaeon]
MAGRERKFAPRLRTIRPLGDSLTTNTPPALPLPSPEPRDGFWYLPAPLSQRLHEKSALGSPTSDGGILLTTEEVMFCHWYRHVPLPEPAETWFDDQVAASPQFGLRTVAMDVLRNGGELVVPRQHLTHRLTNLHSSTWAVRWQRHEPWTKNQGYSQVRLQHTNDLLDWDELFGWVVAVIDAGHVPELCVVDDEFDATVYHLQLSNPTGMHRTLQQLSDDEQAIVQRSCKTAKPMTGGYFLLPAEPWPLSAVGVEHFGGRFLREEEHRYLIGSRREAHDDVYDDLSRRGLLLRPGFKYGCKWRVYENAVHVEHAPWLVQRLSHAPATWEEVCLAVRLAEGVNKRWLCAIPHSGLISYLNIHRNA